MIEDKLWSSFAKTGSVKAYLNYRENVRGLTTEIGVLVDPKGDKSGGDIQG